MKTGISRWIMAAAAALTSLLALAGPVRVGAATKYVVDDNFAECPAATHSGPGSIQTAVNQAIANNVHTIEICAGTYFSFSITGANTLKIYAKDPLNRPRINAPATNGGSIINVQNSKKVTLDGLYLNGENFTDNGLNLMNGVLYHNSDGAIQNMVIYGIASFPDFSDAISRAVSIIDDNDDGKASSIKISTNKLNVYQTAGVYIEGQVGATIKGNTIQGLDHVVLTGDAPQGGIELTANTHGTPAVTITGNYLFYNFTGFIVHTVPKVKFAGNLIDYARNGIVIESSCFAPGSSASKTSITGNRFIHLTDYALLIVATSLPGATCASHADGIKVSGNQMHANADGEALAISGAAANGGPFPAKIDKLSITKNTLWGYLDVASVSNATHLIVSGNTLYHQ